MLGISQHIVSSTFKRVPIVRTSVESRSLSSNTPSIQSFMKGLTLGYSGNKPASFRLFNEASHLLKIGKTEEGLKMAHEAKKAFEEEYKNKIVLNKDCGEVIDILISNAEKRIKKA